MISDKRPVQDFVSLLVVHRIQHVIITPGSRNAPFSLSLFEHADIHSYSIVDERSAAFIALGMAQQLEQPVVLICTSGTAALNFAPAIAEAYYQRVPLIVVTADRPVEWIDQGEGQSIRQRNVYSNYVKASIEIAEEASEGDLVWYNNRIMDEALRTSVEGVHGPIHINFPLRESLYKVTDQTIAGVKTVNRARTHLSIAKFELDEIVFKMNNSSKIMVLAGQMPPDSDLHLALVGIC
jgi:2-succinyl-5-enolpyruvyl-6-hydroxy-3-cyclohexene-1-carboxylate synthase